MDKGNYRTYHPFVNRVSEANESAFYLKDIKNGLTTQL